MAAALRFGQQRRGVAACHSRQPGAQGFDTVAIPASRKHGAQLEPRIDERAGAGRQWRDQQRRGRW